MHKEHEVFLNYELRITNEEWIDTTDRMLTAIISLLNL